MAGRIHSLAGYIVEYKDNSGLWVEISRGGNTNKFAPGNYSFQVSASKIISSLSDPYVIFNGRKVDGLGPDYLEGYDCASGIACQIPVTQYNAGEIVGPIIYRIRVFA